MDAKFYVLQLNAFNQHVNVQQD